MASNYYLIAAIYTDMGQYEQALDAFEQACEYFLYCEHNDGKNVSLTFRGYNGGEWHSDELSYCRDFLTLLSRDSSLKPLRGHSRYIEIVEKLRKNKSEEKE